MGGSRTENGEIKYRLKIVGFGSPQKTLGNKLSMSKNTFDLKFQNYYEQFTCRNPTYYIQKANIITKQVNHFEQKMQPYIFSYFHCSYLVLRTLANKHTFILQGGPLKIDYFFLNCTILIKIICGKITNLSHNHWIAITVVIAELFRLVKK